MKFAAKTFFKNKIHSKDSGLESLVNELTILRRINHPTLLQLNEVFETENSYYVITNLLSGGNLLRRIKSVHKLTD